MTNSALLAHFVGDGLNLLGLSVPVCVSLPPPFSASLLWTAVIGGWDGGRAPRETRRAALCVED